MSARDDYPRRKPGEPIPEDAELISFAVYMRAMAEVDRLRSENETLRRLVTPAPIEESRYDDALHAELAALRRWKQEACEWLAAINKTVAQHAKPPVPNLVDLLRRAGKEVQP